MTSVHARVASARVKLTRAGISEIEAGLDARLLAEFVLGWDAAGFFSHGGENEPCGFSDAYERLVSRRVAREPIGYIVGRQEFWGLEFEVNPAVLIPRPETELLIEAALALWPDRDAPLRVADVCTGSGCIAVALATEYRHATIVATDLSTDALNVAERNAVRHRVGDRVQLVRTDLLANLDGRFDVVVAN